MTKYEGTVPLLQFCGGLVPPSPVIYAHGGKAKPKPTGRCLLARTLHIISLMIVHTVFLVLRIGLIIFPLQVRIWDFVRGWVTQDAEGVDGVGCGERSPVPTTGVWRFFSWKCYIFGAFLCGFGRNLNL